MLRDSLLQERYLAYINSRIELAEKEVVRTKGKKSYQKLARLYRQFFVTIKATYEYYHFDLLAAFKKHHLSGQLEIITTAATHGFLPVLNQSETAVRHQINRGIDTFASLMGFSPSGFWLPECGYYSGVEQLLKEAGIYYFFVDTHGVMDATSSPKNDVYAPLDCGNGVMAFARDPESSQQVWSAQEGYPSDEHYREYYSDIGFELELEAVSPYILDRKTRINTGIKYHRVTGRGDEKEVYDPVKAKRQAELDAMDFVSKRQKQVNELAAWMDRKPMIISPYDAELFGHWWAEGVYWLEHVMRLASDSESEIQLIHCSDYLCQKIEHQVATPSASTWGDQGYSSYWINEKNSWIYPYLHQMAEEMEQLAIDFSSVSVLPLQERALNQALRTLLQAQASDWAFILKSGTTTEYATKRINDCFSRFNYLHQSIRRNKIDEHYLLALETMDNAFPELDYRDYKPIISNQPQASLCNSVP
jgi:1,4-alpha-glucan branching enzyme